MVPITPEPADCRPCAGCGRCQLHPDGARDWHAPTCPSLARPPRVPFECYDCGTGLLGLPGDERACPACLAVQTVPEPRPLAAGINLSGQLAEIVSR